MKIMIFLKHGTSSAPETPWALQTERVQTGLDKDESSATLQLIPVGDAVRNYRPGRTSAEIVESSHKLTEDMRKMNRY